MKKITLKSVAFTVLCLLIGAPALAANIIDFQLIMLSGNQTRLALTLDANAPTPQSYSINEPAWIVVDLADTASSLEQRNIELNSGNVISANFAEAGSKVRMSVSLSKMAAYTVKAEGNNIYVDIESVNVAKTVAPKAALDVATAAKTGKAIGEVQFRRGENGEGQISIDFGRNGVDTIIREEGGRIVVLVPDFNFAPGVAAKYDVKDFATAVKYVTASKDGTTARIEIEPTGYYDYLAYQVGSVQTIEVKQLTEAEAEEQSQSRFPYTGQKLTLNFQDIDVRDSLQIIAEYNDLNLVASDSIQGKLTLRLKNVPWDQALDLVLKTKGLDKRLNGNVLRVAPASEIAEQEKLELESNRQVEQLAPLRTEFLQINYAKAADIADIIKTQGGGESATEFGLSSDRGTVKVDERTNTLMIHDTDAAITKIKKAVQVFDVPVRQVQIDARIVVASTSVGRELGIRWGGAGDSGRYTGENGMIFLGSGSLESNVTASNHTIQSLNGEDPSGDYVEFPQALAVDLPAQDSSASSLAVGITALDYVLDLELSALENTGNAEIVSQPKIVTADGHSAKILSGSEIPYATMDGVEFRRAVLSLEVEPEITPDGRMKLDLKITQDSIGKDTTSGPTINKNELNTQVLVDDGETIVLGGIYRVEEVISVDKTPFLGDLPFIGNLFKRTKKTESKSELLIFITPRLIDETLTIR